MFQRFGSAGSASPAPRSSSALIARVVGLGLLLLLAVPADALAAETRPGDVITIGSNETINDDLYVAGRTIEVLGTIRGDLIAAGATVMISGTVTGDVAAGAGQIRVTGDVGGSVRTVGGDIAIDGRVGEDVIGAAGNVSVGSRGTVGRDVYVGSGALLISGRVGRNVTAGAGDMTISAPVGGDVQAEAGRLRLTQGASVGGALRYTSDEPADIAQGVPIQGGVQQRLRERRPEGQPTPPIVDILIVWLRAVVGLFVLGLLLELLAPGISARTLATVTRTPAVSILTGILAFFIIPLVAALVFFVGFLLGGWWIGLIILALYGVILAASVPILASAVGRLLLDALGRRRVHFAWALLLGVVVVTLVGLIPIAGGLLVGLAALVAFGGLLLSLFRRPAAADTPGTPPPVAAPPPAPTPAV